jgi:hypothetical protein
MEDPVATKLACQEPLLPGDELMAKLRAIRSDRWLTLECRLRGDPRVALPAAVELLAPFR